MRAAVLYRDNLKYSCIVGATHWERGVAPERVTKEESMKFMITATDRFAA